MQCQPELQALFHPKINVPEKEKLASTLIGC